MPTRIKRIPATEYARLRDTATRDELLQVLAQYVARPPGRVPTGAAVPRIDRVREFRARRRQRKIQDHHIDDSTPSPDTAL